MKLNKNSDKIKVTGHTGTWYVIDTRRKDGKQFFLLESEQWGDDAPSIIVDIEGELFLDNVYSGLDELDY